MAGWPGRSTALAMSVAAASASEAVLAMTVTASAMPERKTAAAPARGRDAARGIAGADRRATPHPGPSPARGEGSDGHADDIRILRAQMQRDVAAVVDIGAPQLGRARHRLQNLLCDRAGDGGHRRDEAARSKRRHRARPCAARRLRSTGEGAGARRSGSSAQSSSRIVAKRRSCRPIGRCDRPRLAFGAENQIDGPVVKMAAPAGKRGNLRARALISPKPRQRIRFSHALRCAQSPRRAAATSST